MNDARKFQILLLSLAATLACACVIFGVILMQSHREFQAFDERRAETQKRLQELHTHNVAQESYLTELLNNPEMIERAARENLGYSREGELIFKFEE